MMYEKLQKKIAKLVGKKAINKGKMLPEWGVIKHVHVEPTGLEETPYVFHYHICYGNFTIVSHEEDTVILL